MVTIAQCRVFIEAHRRILGNVQTPLEAVGKRPSAVRQAHGPEQSRGAALPSSLVTAAYFYVRLIPRDFGSLAYGHFPSASRKPVFGQSCSL